VAWAFIIDTVLRPVNWGCVVRENMEKEGFPSLIRHSIHSIDSA
jgi:hypothetical protein